MKYIINFLIVALVAGFAYLLVVGIQDPIKFRAELDKRKNVVVAKLEHIRTAQEMYREIRGDYADSFDELSSVLKTDSIPFAVLLADPSDPTNPDKFITEYVYANALDSLTSLEIDLDNLRYVPYTNKTAEFTMTSDTITYQSTKVPVLECMTRWADFMGEYADPKFGKYAKSYNPSSKIGFGSMTSPNLEGNWN